MTGARASDVDTRGAGAYIRGMTTTTTNPTPSKCAALGCAWPTSGSQCPDCGAQLVTGAQPEPRQYIARYFDGALRVLTATQLASDLAHAADGNSDAEPITVWTFVDGQPVNVGVRSRRGQFDEDDYADMRVELVNPADGTVLDVTGYRVDGRA